MQARYYDPAVGRFTQLDPVRYGPETFATGQNNRWTYCANDPVNASDPSGRALSPNTYNNISAVLTGISIMFGWAGAYTASALTGLAGVAANLAATGLLQAAAPYVLAVIAVIAVIALLFMLVHWLAEWLFSSTDPCTIDSLRRINATQ